MISPYLNLAQTGVGVGEGRAGFSDCGPSGSGVGTGSRLENSGRKRTFSSAWILAVARCPASRNTASRQIIFEVYFFSLFIKISTLFFGIDVFRKRAWGKSEDVEF